MSHEREHPRAAASAPPDPDATGAPEALSEPGPEVGHIDFPCQSCGAKLEFKPGTEHLECPYCGGQQVLDRPPPQPIVEYSFEAALKESRQVASRSLLPEGRLVSCQGCGAKSVVSGAASRCAFCDAPVVIVDEDAALFVPESVLPFGIDEKRAVAEYRRWIASRWFAPGDLASRAKEKRLSGVYLPYWTYDSKTTTRYAGMRGDHYYVTESYRDSNGQTRTRRVQKTRWTPAAGVVRVSFDDVLVPATKSLPSTMLDKLEPWDLAELRAYEPAYLSGFSAERYSVGLEEGFALARVRMDPEIRAAICRDIGGDTQMIGSMNVSHADVRFKHFLLPLWISAFRYRDKVFRFVVNARTGETGGERPYSALKIAAAIVVLTAVVAGLVYLYLRTQG